MPGKGSRHGAAAGRAFEAGRGASARQLGARMAADSAPITTYLMAAGAEETGKEGSPLCACAQIELVFSRESLVPLRVPRSAESEKRCCLRPLGGATTRLHRENRFRSSRRPSIGTGTEAGPWNRISPRSLSLPPAPCLPQSRAEPFSFIA